ncbi:unnamed protein product (macronuclear) [Paramecium tetraurelia]|uniref:Ubiquitin-like domain-containing protein n=1 Tax=Paramecium tetraurelia TaxID=5888 RepID=A0BGN8_PARTE|nr:uncharacterized protein GSPATT00028740001 [Paramecium tetraurelia]CAK57705.1 unnamed protein product [Paramecium tetraurelia]|eukprot:XP_001425103.1 hypothetical protein (macronuclear) [Paramecium tetraurelia strain d4-2]
MEIELEIEIFDSTCKTTLCIDDTVSINELIEFIQTTHSQKLNGLDQSNIQIQIQATGQVIIPSNNSLQQVLGGLKKAKLLLQKKQLQYPNQNNLDIQPSGSQNRPYQQNQIDYTNSQARNQPQVLTTLPQQQQQQVYNTQQSKQFNINIKNGNQQIQLQLSDNITIHDLILASQQSLGVDLQHQHLYHGTKNLSLMNPQTTLNTIGLQYFAQLDWKVSSQINQFQNNQQANFNQRPVQQNNVINQSHFQGQNPGGQTQYNSQQNQQYNQQQPYQQQQYQQQPYQQQNQQYNQQQNVQQTNMAYQQQQQQQYQQQQQQQLQQSKQGQYGQSQVNNPPQSNVQSPGKQITINFEIQDGQIVRQFSTITNTNNTLLQLQEAVYQYLGISKDAASVDLFINETPLGGGKLPLTLKMLQLTKEYQTFKVKVRWVGG